MNLKEQFQKIKSEIMLSYLNPNMPSFIQSLKKIDSLVDELKTEMKKHYDAIQPQIWCNECEVWVHEDTNACTCECIHEKDIFNKEPRICTRNEDWEYSAYVPWDTFQELKNVFLMEEEVKNDT